MSFDILPCHKVHYFKTLFQIFLFKDYWEWSRWCFWTRGGIYIPIKGTIRKTLLRSERDYLALLVGEYKIWKRYKKYEKRYKKFGMRLFGRFAHLWGLLAFKASYLYAGVVPCTQNMKMSKKVQQVWKETAKVVFVAIMIMNYSKNDEATCQQVFIHIMLPGAQSLQKKFLIRVSFPLNTSFFFPCSETCC